MPPLIFPNPARKAIWQFCLTGNEGDVVYLYERDTDVANRHRRARQGNVRRGRVRHLLGHRRKTCQVRTIQWGRITEQR